MSPSAPRDRESSSAEYKRLWALAWPVMLAHLSWIALNLIDIAMVGRAGTEPLAAMGIGRTLSWVSIVVPIGLMSGIAVFVSRAVGAGRLHQTAAILRQGIAYALVIGLIVLALLLPGAKTFLGLFGLDPALVDGGSAFVRVIALGVPATLVHTACFYFLEGLGRPGRGAPILLAGIPVNVALNWVFIYGNLGSPALGATGAAIGTAATQWIMLGAFLFSVWRLPDRTLLGLGAPGAWRGVWRSGQAMRRFGYAPGLAQGLELAGFSLLGLLSGRIGATEAAAYQVALGLHTFAFTVAIGLGSATSVRVGNAVGERNWAAITPRVRASLVMTTALMGLAGLIFAFAAAPLAAAFASDPRVVALAAAMLTIVAGFLIFDGIQYVLVFALRAAGDPIVASINSIVCYLLIMGAAAILMVEHWGWGAPGLAWAMVIGITSVALLQGARFLWLARTGWPAMRAQQSAPSE